MDNGLHQARQSGAGRQFYRDLVGAGSKCRPDRLLRRLSVLLNPHDHRATAHQLGDNAGRQQGCLADPCRTADRQQLLFANPADNFVDLVPATVEEGLVARPVGGEVLVWWCGAWQTDWVLRCPTRRAKGVELHLIDTVGINIAIDDLGLHADHVAQVPLDILADDHFGPMPRGNAQVFSAARAVLRLLMDLIVIAIWTDHVISPRTDRLPPLGIRASCLRIPEEAVDVMN